MFAAAAPDQDELAFLETHAKRPEQIKDNEAHLWYTRPDRVADSRLVHHYRRLLSDEERDRVERYRFAKDRHAGLITRAMVRCLLSRYVAVEPSRWRFRMNPYGRPEIADPNLASTPRFSVAHTDGMIVVLISKDWNVGVDVERLRHDGSRLQVAEHYFTPSEVAALRSLTPSEQAVRFLELWTLKESFVKARGVGLTAPLNEFSFANEEGPANGIEVSFDPTLEDDPERWQFDLAQIGDEHVVATAIERCHDQRIRLVRREALWASVPCEPGDPPSRPGEASGRPSEVTPELVARVQAS